MIFGKSKSLSLENQRLTQENARLQEQISKLENQLTAQKSQNNTLKNQIEELLQRLSVFENQSEQLRLKMDKKLVERYNCELWRLKNFIERYQNALPEPDKGIDGKKRMALCMAIAEILKDKPCVSTIEEGMALLDKLNGVMGGNAISESGFNLDEVLNPGNELDLESLCKELGVMD